ncbi:MLO-like protein isoform X1 [Gossypium raimondii]|uniref:MLO-like protein isoform X1 n=2 Tax=Gossypium raimondii TaxID=29730 RepID=UPI00227C02CD|nr:MLO-like protein isoform X1 [Gossypium raimondii]XP_052488107.1 MLO-like protein isoform X1 [Gossypium raimondii]
MAHLALENETKFDFQKYIKRSLEDDFKVVIGISPIIWFIAVLFLLAYTHGWYSYLWLPFIPLIYEFTIRSCYHEHIEDVIIRVSMGVIIQFLFSYVTHPLYALVTQVRYT